jgi:hypothetical protein
VFYGCYGSPHPPATLATQDPATLQHDTQGGSAIRSEHTDLLIKSPFDRMSASDKVF